MRATTCRYDCKYGHRQQWRKSTQQEHAGAQPRSRSGAKQEQEEQEEQEQDEEQDGKM